MGQQQMPMRPPTPLLRQPQRMLTQLLMLQLRQLKPQRKLLLLLGCRRAAERNTCRGSGTLWLLPSTLSASTSRWTWRLREDRGPVKPTVKPREADEKKQDEAAGP